MRRQDELVACGSCEWLKDLKKQTLPFGMEMELRLVDHHQGLLDVEGIDR